MAKIVFVSDDMILPAAGRYVRTRVEEGPHFVTIAAPDGQAVRIPRHHRAAALDPAVNTIYVVGVAA